VDVSNTVPEMTIAYQNPVKMNPHNQLTHTNKFELRLLPCIARQHLLQGDGNTFYVSTQSTHTHHADPLTASSSDNNLFFFNHRIVRLLLCSYWLLPA
jgi:hypothetical protein